MLLLVLPTAGATQYRMLHQAGSLLCTARSVQVAAATSPHLASTPEGTTLAVHPAPQPPLAVRNRILLRWRKQARWRSFPLDHRGRRCTAQRRYAAVRTALAVLPAPETAQVVHYAGLRGGDARAAGCGLPSGGSV